MIADSIIWTIHFVDKFHKQLSPHINKARVHIFCSTPHIPGCFQTSCTIWWAKLLRSWKTLLETGCLNYRASAALEQRLTWLDGWDKCCVSLFFYRYLSKEYWIGWNNFNCQWYYMVAMRFNCIGIARFCSLTVPALDGHSCVLQCWVL